MTNNAQMQEYLVLRKIGGAGDPQMWLPGSKILLDDVAAAAHLRAGNIAPLDHTQPPVEKKPAMTVHRPESEDKSKRKRGE